MGESPRGEAQSHRPFPAERYLPYLTTTDIEALPKDEAAVVLVISAIEQHGPHLPIVTDLLLGEELLARALERVEPAVALWVLPPLAYGKSNEHRRFAGTVTLSQSTLAAVIADVARSVARAGFRRLILLNSHGGNPPVLDYSARDIREETGLMVFPVSTFRIGLDLEQVSDDEAEWGTHAGEVETSMLLELCPDLVHMDRAAELGEHATFSRKADHVRLHGPVTFAWVTEELSRSGAIGDPRPATRERGEAIVEATVARLAEVLAELARFEMPTPAPGGDD